MKTLKNATQKNVLVNCEFYTMNEINAYLDEHVFFTLNKDFSSFIRPCVLCFNAR